MSDIVFHIKGTRSVELFGPEYLLAFADDTSRPNFGWLWEQWYDSPVITAERARGLATELGQIVDSLERRGADAWPASANVRATPSNVSEAIREFGRLRAFFA